MAKKSSSVKWYTSLPWIVKLLVAIFFIGYFVHLVYRILAKKWVAAILWFFVPISWVVDIVCVVLYGRPCEWPGL